MNSNAPRRNRSSAFQSGRASSIRKIVTHGYAKLMQNSLGREGHCVKVLRCIIFSRTNYRRDVSRIDAAVFTGETNILTAPSNISAGLARDRDINTHGHFQVHIKY